MLLFAILGLLCALASAALASKADSDHRGRQSRLDALHKRSKEHRSFKRIYDEYNFIEHTNSSLIRDFGDRSLKQFRFVHFPKTGTTFAATMVHYCCPGLDNQYINALRQFNTFLPSFSLGAVCDPVCFSIQPRSKNGDPWAHIPYRAGASLDSNNVAVGMFRSPEARLASQLSYMQVMGPKLSTSFGFRRFDGQILHRLLSCSYDHELKDLLTREMMPSKLEDYAFDLTSADTHRELQFTNTPFVTQALACIDLQSKLDLPAALLTTMQDMNTTIFSSKKLLEQHFIDRPEVMEALVRCGREAVVLYPGLQGCQTRMLLGRTCFDSYSLTAEDVNEAKRRLSEEFLFVGKQHVNLPNFF